MNKTIKTTPSVVYISDKKKDGTELIDKNGSKYTKVAIKIPEMDDVWLSCLCYPPKGNYAPKKELEMVANEPYWIKIEQNGDFYNFRLASKVDILETRMDTIEEKLEFLYKKTQTGNTLPVIEADEFEPEPEPDDMPDF